MLISIICPIDIHTYVRKYGWICFLKYTKNSTFTPNNQNNCFNQRLDCGFLCKIIHFCIEYSNIQYNQTAKLHTSVEYSNIIVTVIIGIKVINYNYSNQRNRTSVENYFSCRILRKSIAFHIFYMLSRIKIRSLVVVLIIVKIVQRAEEIIFYTHFPTLLTSIIRVGVLALRTSYIMLQYMFLPFDF